MSTPISPRTALCGIVLHPVGHTRSPAMHQAAFEALGIDAVYLAFDVAPAALWAAIAGARALGVRQLAVSIPHKVAVMEYLDAVDDTARRIGAVNTATRREEGDEVRLVGYHNIDIFVFKISCDVYSCFESPTCFSVLFNVLHLPILKNVLSILANESAFVAI